MRKGFDYDDEDDQDDLFPDTDDDGDEEMDAEDYAEIMARNEALERQQLEMVQLDLNQRLLFKSMEMLSKSWWWSFYSAETKTKMLTETYMKLHGLVRDKKEDNDANLQV
jgi:hypothetical protein